MKNITTSQFISSYIVAILITVLTAYTVSYKMSETGIPWFFGALVGFLIGVNLPKVILSWIYKAEIAESQSEQNPEE